jgi:hypothetical protein
MTKDQIKVVVVVSICLIAFPLINKYLLDRQPLKERKQLCVINSNGWSHVYPVNGRNVKIEYEDD